MLQRCVVRRCGLNPLTRIHCLPTVVFLVVMFILPLHCLNPLTRIHCLPTVHKIININGIDIMSQSPDEDSLSSDRRNYMTTISYQILQESQSPDEDSLSSDAPLSPCPVAVDGVGVSIP